MDQTNDALTTMTSADDAIGTRESMGRTANWIRDNLANSNVRAPEVAQGQTVIAQRRDGERTSGGAGSSSPIPSGGPTPGQRRGPDRARDVGQRTGAALPGGDRRPRPQAGNGAVKATMPVWIAPLIGREHERAWVRAALQRPNVRLLTLIGPGGVGKTRLARELTAELAPQFPDGAHFVSLT